MTLGGRRVAMRHPRMRTADGERELSVKTYEYFADRDPLTRAVMDRMLAGVSTRRFAGVGEPVGDEVETSSTATSKTSVSEMFVERTRTALDDLMSRRLDDVRLAVMMLDGIEIAAHARRRARDHDRRGQDPARAMGGLDRERRARRGPRAAPVRARSRSRAGDPVRDRRRQGAAEGDQGRVRGARARAPLPPPQGAQRLRAAARVGARSSPGPGAAWALTDAQLAGERLELLASELDRSWPDAGHSLREGLDDTLTLMRLGITEQLAKTLCSTNPCESMIEIVRYTQRSVKRWQDGDMRKRWTGRRHARRRATVPPDQRLPRPRQARHRDRAPRHARRPEEA